MNTLNVNQDGVMIFWDSKQAPREDVKAAFRSVGAEDLLPLFDPIECLKMVGKTIVDQAKIKVRGQPIEFRQLRRDVIGVVAVREIKGVKRNEYKPLFSLGCEGDSIDNFVVRFFDVDTTECPVIAQNVVQLEQVAKQLWIGDKDWMPAKDLTEGMRRLLFRLRGTMLKKSGGLYFLFKDMLPDFEAVVRQVELSDTEAEFTIAHSKIEFDDRMFKCVIKGLEEEVLLHTQKMQDDVSSLADGGAKMRRNGIERRLKDICEWTDKVEYYEQSMNTSLPVLRQAIEDAKYAIGVHGLASMAASN